MPWWNVGATLVGGLLSSNAADRATGAQQASDMARLAEEKRVREQLRQDTETQRAVADQAFKDYQNGLISYAEAQQKASNAYADIQKTIGESQLSDTAKAMQMSQFTPYSIRTGSGRTFFDQDKGVAGYALSPELQAMQQQAYSGAGQAVGSLATTPEAAAQKYMEQQQGLLTPQRQSEDIALRQQQLQRGRIGLGISSEAAGAGTGGMVNPEQFSRDRARAIADAEIAARATQAGQQQAISQAQLAQNLYNLGASPEEMGRGMLGTGLQYGQQQQLANQNLASLYSGGMSDYYKSMLGAAGTQQQAALFAPLASQTAAQEAYQRQQQYLTGLQRSELPYKAMTTPQPYIPGSAYAMAGLGSGLMNAGMQGINRYMNNPPPPVTDGGYSVGQGSAYNWGYDPYGNYNPLRTGL